MDSQTLSAVVAAAVQAALAAGAQRTPVPGSAAPPEMIAQGPPLLPAASVGYEVRPEPNLEKALDNFMKMRPMSSWKHPLIFLLLQTLYKKSATNFTLLGGVHTTEDGSRTYFSVRVNGPEMHYNCIMHLYGSVRGTHFNIKSVDVYHYDREYKDTAVCAPSPPSSVANDVPW